jgi:hypothetical protein
MAAFWAEFYWGRAGPYLPLGLLFATFYLATLIRSLRPSEERRAPKSPEKLLEEMREIIRKAEGSDLPDGGEPSPKGH